MRFYYRSLKVNEQPVKKEIKPTTEVEAATVRQVLTLVGQGYSYRQIQAETGIKTNKIYKIVNGLYRLKESSRCSECGKKLTEEIDVCRECRLREKYGENPEEDPPKEEEEDCLKLELRPKEYERYLMVRQRKIEEIERRIKQEQEEEERRRRRFDYD